MADSEVTESSASLSTEDRELLETAKKRFDLCVDSVKDIRREALDDLNFLAGDQWPENIRRQKEAEGSVLLTINRLPAMLHQVSNAIRQNRVSGRVSPVDDKADVDTAEILQGHIRHIEYDSQAIVAYTNAGFYGAGIGFGFYEVLTEFSDPKSFDQDIKIGMVENPFTILHDPTSIKPDASDADYYFKIIDFKKDEYKEAFPKSRLAEGEWLSIGAEAPDWIHPDSVRVVEYTYKDKKPDILYQLKDGSTVLKSEMKEDFDKSTLAIGEDSKPVIRATESYKVKRCKLNGVEVLEATVKPGQYLGLVKATGDSFVVDGKRIVHGVIRNAKEPQRQYNYMKSAQTQAIALTPKAKWLACEGQIDKKQRKYWEESNVKNHVVLEYKQVDVAGKPAPPPQYILAAPNVSAITEALMEAHADLQYTTGIHDAQLGAKSNEKSGIAIEQRKMQGETGNMHYVDNLTISVGFGCRQIVDMAPFVYDTKRSIRIIGEDDSYKVVRLNEETDYKGQKKTFRYDVGKYDVVCSAGPSFQTKLQEAADVMTSLVKAFPDIMPIAGDLVIKGLNIPYGNELAERFKKTLPEHLREAEDGKQEIPPEAQQAIAQAKQQLMALNAYAQQLEGELKQLQMEKQAKVIETQGRKDIEILKIEGNLTAAEITTKYQAINERLTLLHDMLKQLGVQSHERAMQTQQQSHDMGVQAAQQQHESSMADQTAAIQSAQSAQDAAQVSEQQNASPANG